MKVICQRPMKMALQTQMKVILALTDEVGFTGLNTPTQEPAAESILALES
jgi:hypothetical protein